MSKSSSRLFRDRVRARARLSSREVTKDWAIAICSCGAGQADVGLRHRAGQGDPGRGDIERGRVGRMARLADQGALLAREIQRPGEAGLGRTHPAVGPGIGGRNDVGAAEPLAVLLAIDVDLRQEAGVLHGDRGAGEPQAGERHVQRGISGQGVGHDRVELGIVQAPPPLRRRRDPGPLEAERRALQRLFLGLDVRDGRAAREKDGGDGGHWRGEGGGRRGVTVRSRAQQGFPP